MPFVVCALLALQILPPAPAAKDPDAPSHRVDFTEVDVRGALERPSVELVWSRPKAHRRNLIALRSSFRAELLSSRDALAPGTR